MKCIYCRQECKEPGYGEEMNHEYCIDLSNGVETVVYIHDKCLPKILGQWVRNKVHPVLYGVPYDCISKVTCDTIPSSTNRLG